MTRPFIRVFVVGCSRSGTTVIQGKLASSLRLYTPPETDFFRGDLASARTRFARLQRLQWLTEHGSLPPETSRQQRWLTVATYWSLHHGPWTFGSAICSRSACATLFTHHLDRMANRADLPGWLEKTPRHFESLDYIRRLVQPDVVVFVVRDGRDVVASIVHRAQTYPDRFPQQGNPTYAIDLWNRSIRIAYRERMSPDVVVVSYDDFCAHPHALVHLLGEKLNMQDTSPISTHQEISLSSEPWKTQANSSITRATSRWTEIFSQQERDAIEKQLELDLFNRLIGTLPLASDQIHL